MEIIHLVFTRNTKAKNNSIADIANQLATEQTKLGLKVSVWEISRRPSEQFQNKVYPFKHFSHHLFLWNSMKEIRRHLPGTGTGKLFHFHGGIVPVYYPIAFHLQENKIPFILSPHGRYNSHTMEKASYLKKKHFENFDQNMISWSSALHFNSEYERKELFNIYPFNQQKTYICPNGLINNNLNIAPKIMKHDEIIYCFYGELNIAAMGIDILLNGFAKFKKNHSNNAILWIIGNGPDRNNILKSIKKLGLHKYVFVKPAVFGALKFEQLSKVDVIVRTPRVDFYPSVIMESAAMSIPCIVSGPTYITEIIASENAGYAISENNSDQLQKAFTESINDMETVQWNRKKMNAHQMVARHFNWTSIARTHIQVYQDIAGR